MGVKSGFRRALAVLTGTAALAASGSASAAVIIDGLDLFDSPVIVAPTLYASKIIDIGPQVLTPLNPTFEISITFAGHQRIVLTDPVPNAGDDERGGFLLVNPSSSGGTGSVLVDLSFTYSGEFNTSPDGSNPDLLSGIPCGAGLGTCSFLGSDRTDGTMFYKDFHVTITVIDFGNLPDLQFSLVSLTAAGDQVEISVPEPAALAVLGVGLLGLSLGRRRRARS